MTPGGASSPPCWSTKPNCMGGPWSGSTAGSRRANCARRVATVMARNPEGPDLDLPRLWHGPRPGPQRSQEHPGGRAGRYCLWTRCKTQPKPGGRGRNRNHPGRYRISPVRNPRPSGRGGSQQGRVDLLAGDEHDRYWVVAHRLVDRFGTADDLLLDEELVAACWAMERFYPGMRIAGTIHNEIRLDPEPAAGTAWSRLRRRLIHSDRQIRRSGHQRGLPQHEASGGGRSLPYARRGAARSRPSDPGPVASEGDGTFRRTRILRDRAELEAMGGRLATEALD